MAQSAAKRMTADEFFVWQQQHEERYELVEGAPVKLMAGASEVHDTIVTNIIASLHQQLLGTPCRPATADLGLRTKIDAVRRPDVTVVCSEPHPDSYEARNPRLAVEVLSPSNRGIPWHRKLEEYRRLDDLRYILLVASDAEQATLIRRDEQGWTSDELDGRASIVELPSIGCRLRLSDAYRGLSFGDAGEP